MDNLTDVKMYLENAKNNLQGLDLSDIEYAVGEAENAVSNMRSYVDDANVALEDSVTYVEDALEEIATVHFSDEDFMHVPTEGAVGAMCIGKGQGSARVAGFSLAGDIPSITIETINGEKYTISGVITETNDRITIGG